MPAFSYVPSLMAALSEVADPRQPRGVRHPFSGILALTLLGMICRIQGFAALSRWAASHWRLLKRPLGFKRGRPPHATTFSRTLAKFSLAEFQEAFSRWLGAILADQDLLCVAVDGKTCCQGFDAQGHPVQMLNVFVQEVKACLGQWPLSGDKLTEPEVLKAHLSELFERYPSLRLITGDALYAQRPLAELIFSSGHDYLFQIKGNQPDVLDAAQTCFAEVTDAEAAVKIVEKRGHAETRVLWVNVADAEYVRDRLGFAGCTMLLRIDRRTKDRQGHTTCETRYFITSLDPAKVTPGKLLKYVRGHWQVENSLHFVKDRWWDEDRHWCRRPGLAERLASLTNVGLTLLRLAMGKTTHPLRAYADEFCWNPLRALKLLGALN